MKTSSASTKAIIFTIILFLFIVFISLLKGIYLYDLNIKNVHIDRLFFKINNKIVLKIDNVDIKPSKNYNKDVTKLHKIIYYSMKTANMLEKVEINNIKYEDLKIDKVLYHNHFLRLYSPFLKFKTALNPDIKNCYLNFSYIVLPEYRLLLKNVLINLHFGKEIITADGFAEIGKNEIDYSAVLNAHNLLKLNINSQKLYLHRKNYALKTNDLDINADIDLDYLRYNVKAYASNAFLKYDNIRARASMLKAQVINDNIQIIADSLYTPKIKTVKNIYAKKLKLSYNTKYKFLFADTKKLSFNYDRYDIKMINNQLVYKNEKNLNFTNNAIILKDQNQSVTLNKNLLNILGDYVSYTINKTDYKSKIANLTSDKIAGNLAEVFTKKINGDVYGFKTSLNDIKVSIKNKTAQIKSAQYNGININHIKYANNKVSFTSNTLFNKNVKEVLSKLLNLNIPVDQLAGTNNIYTEINIKPFDFNTDIALKDSLFKIFNFDLLVKKGAVNVNKNRLNLTAKQAVFYLLKDLPIYFDTNGHMVFKSMKMVFKTLLNFKYKNLIALKNFKETLTLDLKKNTMHAKNLSLLVDFEKKELILSPLKNALKYSFIKKFITNGILLVNFKKEIKVYAYLFLKLPVLLEHNNKKMTDYKKVVVKKAYFNVHYAKDTLKIDNNNIHVKIKGQDISASIQNLDINLEPLEKYVIESNTSESSEQKNNISIHVYTDNANLVYKTHKFLSRTAIIDYVNSNVNFKSMYKKSSIHGYTKHNYLLLEGNHFTNEEITALLPGVTFFQSINTDFVLVKSPDNFYTGKVYINSAVIKDLKTLNNIIAFINTIPSLLSFSSPGYSAKGYKIEKGFVSYLLYKNILYIKQAKIYGKNLDFFAKGYIDLNKNYIFMKIQANMKMKLKKIPVVGKGLSYLLFGKDGSIDIKIVVKGDMNNPEVKEDIGKDILLSPFKLFKRAITLPFNLF